jgi:hypothetical protein
LEKFPTEYPEAQGRATKEKYSLRASVLPFLDLPGLLS